MRRISIIVAIALAQGGCGLTDLLDDNDNTPVCVPDAARNCDCPTGGSGQQLCDDTGLDYGACTCTVDGDAGVDAGSPDSAPIDAGPPDAGIDAPP